MNDKSLVTRLRECTCRYCNDEPLLLIDDAANEIERLEAELAAANATIKLVYDYDSNFIHALARAERVAI